MGALLPTGALRVFDLKPEPIALQILTAADVRIVYVMALHYREDEVERHVGCTACGQMPLDLRRSRVAMLILVVGAASTALATPPDPAEFPTERFLSQSGRQPSYRATRRLEAANGSRAGWIEASTAYSAATGFRYQIVRGGGSSYIRDNVLKAVLDAEREMIAQGEAARSALATANYTFQPNGIDADGLANVLVSPRRKERALISGVMFLRPAQGELVRLQGRLAKNPSFWVKDVEIIRKYARINSTVVPVAMDSTARVRFLGAATFSMTYDYVEIDGRPVTGR